MQFYLFIYLLWDNKQILYFIAIGGYILALIGTTYYFVVDGSSIGDFVLFYLRKFISTRNGINVGLIYISLGIWLSDKNNYVRNMSLRKKVGILVIVYLILIVEILFTYDKKVLDDSSCFIILPVVTIFLFALSLKIKMFYSYDTSIILRKISIYIYCLHSPLIWMFDNMSIDILKIYYIKFIVVMMICIIAYCLLSKTKNRFIHSILC